jgi:putative ABC transport system ATP-binding protein
MEHDIYVESSMLSLKRLSKVYRTTEVETTALRDVDLEIAQGEFVAVMGPSGCGKSTLLNIVGMIDTPSGGEYWFVDQNIAGWTESQLSQLRMNSIGFIFQSFNLINDLTIYENVELALLYHREVPARERKDRVQEALDSMKVAHRAKHRPQQLSGGQQQRVAIARAMVGCPKLLLADEPTGNLDSAMGEEVMDLLSELNATGVTIVMVTHSPAHAENANRIVNLLDGAIVVNKMRHVV